MMLLSKTVSRENMVQNQTDIDCLHSQILKYYDFLKNYSPKAETFSTQKGSAFTKFTIF